MCVSGSSLSVCTRLILRQALLLDAFQAPLPREGESQQGRASPGAGQRLQVVPLELSLTRKISSQPRFTKSGQPKAGKLPRTVPLVVQGHGDGEFGIRSWQWLADQAKSTSWAMQLCAD